MLYRRNGDGKQAWGSRVIAIGLLLNCCCAHRLCVSAFCVQYGRTRTSRDAGRVDVAGAHMMRSSSCKLLGSASGKGYSLKLTTVV